MLAWHVSLLLEQDSSVPVTRVLTPYSMLLKLLDFKRVIWFLPGVAGDQTIGQTWYFSWKSHHLILIFDFMHKKSINFGICMSQPPVIRLRYFIRSYPIMGLWDYGLYLICKPILVGGRVCRLTTGKRIIIFILYLSLFDFLFVL